MFGGKQRHQRNARGYLGAVEQCQPFLGSQSDGRDPGVLQGLVGRQDLPVDAYLGAQARRRAVTARWDVWFREHRIDALLEPTSAVTAPARGSGYDAGRPAGGTDPLTMFTATWNVTGFPVAALPAGIGSRSGLPVGVSLIGAPDADVDVLALGIALQDAAPPPVWSPGIPNPGIPSPGIPSPGIPNPGIPSASSERNER